jgi:hypothetical protein
VLGADPRSHGTNGGGWRFRLCRVDKIGGNQVTSNSGPQYVRGNPDMGATFHFTVPYETEAQV